MIEKLDKVKIEALPRAAKSDGFYFCPFCWHPLCEPIEGKGKFAIWCRRCRTHIIVEMDEK